MALKEVALKEVALKQTTIEEAALVKEPHRHFFKRWLSSSPWVLFYFFFWFAYFSYFWLFVFEYKQQGGLTVGQANMWADWALHFTMGHAMAYRELFLEHSPLLLNHEFSYPFAINLISALLLKAGLSLIPAFVIPSYLFSLLLVFALYYFLNTLFKNKAIAVCGAFLFFFNGGIGFIYFIQDILAADNSWQLLLNPNKEYTHLATEQIKFISIINSIILPQRSFTMGFGLTLIALAIVLRSFNLNNSRKELNISKNYIWSAFLLGLMPIIHMHSFLAAFVFLCCWSISDLIASKQSERIYRLKQWSLLALLTTLISLPLLFHYFFNHLDSGFIKWFPGWYAKEFKMDWFVFWFKNWTLVPLLAFIAILYLLKARIKTNSFVRQIGLYLPAFIIFALINLVIFQPWLWDNTKLLAWSGVIFSGLSLWLLFQLIEWKKSWFNIILVTVLGFVICLSGLIDVYRNIRQDLHRHQMYSKTELELASWVKDNTSEQSIWLVSNKHNHWLFNLTGRRAVMTYDGWLWSHGYDYTQIKKDTQTIFKTANAQLIKTYAIDYIILDNQILKENGLASLIFNMKFKMVKKMGQYRVFKISL